ncbi:MAG: sigma-70 family RNA polymerase sigma factor [Ignavibacteriales bacterium]|nr:sigma-70 family RNA polymerase sigma factor [Ignavibacteriales bacterium]
MDNTMLWSSFKVTPTSDLKKQIIMNYTNLVHYVIRKSRFKPVNIIDEKDYFQFGIEGLSEAIDRFDPDYGTKFETYAIQRIKGKIIDEIRKVQIKPRWNNNDENEIVYTNLSLTNSVDGDEGFQLCDIIPNDTELPDETLNKNEFKKELVKAITELDKREKLVLTLYYYEDLNYKEIAQILNLTVSRISQLHSGIIRKLRSSIKKEYC